VEPDLHETDALDVHQDAFAAAAMTALFISRPCAFYDM
jgi:hypothetical protein